MMRIKITTTFIDRQASDPDDAEIESGKEITVTAERGAELIAAGVANEVAAKSEPKPKPARKRAESSPVEPVQSPTPVVVADSATA